MAGIVTKWTDERVAHAKQVVQQVGSIRGAAKTLGVSEPSLRSVLQDRQIDYRALLAPPPPLGVVEPPKPGGPPPWQHYRPKPGYKKPPRTLPSTGGTARPTRSLVFTDLHVPHHDRRAWGVVLGVARDYKPDRVINLGDFLDLESLSRHPRSQPDIAHLAQELHEGNLALDEIQNAAPGAELVCLEGNHEHRAARWVNEWGQLKDVLDVASALYLTPRDSYHRAKGVLRGGRWVPLREQPCAIGAISLLHGVAESKHHAAHHAEVLGPSIGGPRVILSGHMHALQVFSAAAGYTAYSLPWLGRMAAHTIQSYVKGKPKPWSHGFALVEESGDSVSVEVVGIKDGKAVVRGRKYG